MSDPNINNSRMSEPKKSNTMAYVIGGLVVAAVLAYILMGTGGGTMVAPATNTTPATTEAPATTPAPATSEAPATTAPAATPPATEPTATTPATPAPATPAVPPAAPANP
jgi:hypothetical protein